MKRIGSPKNGSIRAFLPNVPSRQYAVLEKDPLREDVKYYFVDFVRKGGTPSPLQTKFLAEKELRIWGGTPPPLPLRTFP